MKTTILLCHCAVIFSAFSCSDHGTAPSPSSQREISGYIPSRPAAGPIYYPFNGNANDESGYNNHGIVNGAALTSDRFGNPNRAYSFNGVSSYISFGTGPMLNPTSGLGISVWIRYNGGSGYTNVVSRWDVFEGINERTYVLNIDESNRLAIWISPDGTHTNAKRILDPNPLSTGSWMHIAVTWDGETMRLFKNGIQIGKEIMRGIRTSPNTRTGIGAALGRNSDPAIGNFNGTIDDLRLYNRALNQMELDALYNER